MNKKSKLIIIGIMMIFLVTGCTYVKPPEALIRKPRSTIENETHNIISEFLGADKTLTLAVNQRNEEAVRRVDIDGDEEYELLVLYREIDEIYRSFQDLGILILKKKGEKWHEINRISAGANNFDLVECVDITGDNKPEIFIGTDNEDGINKNLTIYSYSDGYFRNIYYSSYRSLGIGDLNENGLSELIIFDKKLESDVKYVKAISYSHGDIVTLDEYVIYNNSYYSNMIVGRASKDKIGIFIDYDSGTYNGYTDLVVMKNNKLIQVLSDIRIRYGQIFKNYTAGSRDINNDGVIEMGFMGKIATSEDYADYYIPYIHKWYQWNGKNDMALVKKEYYNYRLGYKISIPLEWGENFAILEKSDEEKVEFYSLDIARKLDKQIFSIKSFKREEWEEEKSNLNEGTYIVLKQDRKRIVVGIIADRDIESNYYIDDSGLKSMFYLIEE